MASYLDYLQGLSSSAKTAKRKADYLRHNFSSLVSGGDEVLEIGPGIGEFLAFAREQRVSAIDVIDRDLAVLDFVGERFAVRNRWCAEVENIASLDATLAQYDVVFLLQVMEHVRREAIIPFLQCLYRHVKPGGRIVITVPNGGNPLGIVERYSDFTHESLYSENSLRQLVAMAGLQDAEASVVGYRIPPSDIANVVRIGVQKMLHLFLHGLLIANGGVAFSCYEPNITLTIRRLR